MANNTPSSRRTSSQPLACASVENSSCEFCTRNGLAEHGDYNGVLVKWACGCSVPRLTAGTLVPQGDTTHRLGRVGFSAPPHPRWTMLDYWTRRHSRRATWCGIWQGAAVPNRSRIPPEIAYSTPLAAAAQEEHPLSRLTLTPTQTLNPPQP